MGVGICYDLRYPEFFRKYGQKEAELIIVPAQWPEIRKDHLITLAKARAIENQCYIVAANQGGLHPFGRETYGHSMIISPWGEVLSELQFGEGVIQGVFDKSLLKEVREAMPVAAHNRFIYSLK